MQSLFTIYHFDYPLTVTLLQMMVVAPVSYFVAKPKWDWALAKSCIPLSVVHVLNVICSLMGKLRSVLRAPSLSMKEGGGGGVIHDGQYCLSFVSLSPNFSHVQAGPEAYNIDVARSQWSGQRGYRLGLLLLTEKQCIAAVALPSHLRWFCECDHVPHSETVLLYQE